MEKRTLIYEGKAKQVFTTDNADVLWIHYLDQATALNGKRKEQIADKGRINSAISALLFNYLTAQGITNHHQQQLSPTDELVTKVKITPVEVVVRNFAAGHFVTRYGVAPMMELRPAVHEFYYKSDELDDPFMNDEQLVALNIAPQRELDELRVIADQVNVILTEAFRAIDIKLIDFKLEFGYTATNQLILADELSPDNMRLVDLNTGASLDKDIFRQQSGDVLTGYKIVLERLTNYLTANQL
ncbi:phosphoribosylaminoimidazolesuccinocarboxamide synthase [Periweissella cryptocerci]|uniref:Phosphoribosylaminoimidazole-succinocarboxamide synthase n=1 Tax=Periweissella cryptocerci TaxID=2506420 RepID=A0A4V1AIH2_9LACO|nr:phosphoribosylaminoimidazolesuccinocarboxamide synthase [Periweissella cryptocerci]QBO35495.1 phosphoribosylaminoimidazolesuccinocarboxamide synthase [Periweissella cryptocerci]